MKVSQLDAKHLYWTEHADFWRRIDLLYRGGYAITRQAELFLRPRPQEPPDMYTARKERFSYQNILGTALGWYVSRLFATEPQWFFRRNGATAQIDYLDRFLTDADRCGTRLLDLARQWFEQAVLCGSVYVLMDLPGADGLAANFREQREGGQLDAYLVTFDASQVINWERDRYGNLEWIVIATEGTTSAFGEPLRRVDRWYYFDRENFRVYESSRSAEAKRDGGDRAATIVAQGRHAMADQRRVPVRRIAVPDSLWLGYRVFPQVLDHLNQDNTLAWGLFMGNVAMPVVIGDDIQQAPKVGEAHWLSLPKGSQFLWSEPAGTTFQISAERVDTLRQEIYRQMYLVAQSRNTAATAAAASGVSKEQDAQPSLDVLNGYGAIFRAALKALLEDAAMIRGEKGVTADVQGLHFEEGDQLAGVGAAQSALDLRIPSAAWERLLYKKAVRIFASNADPDTLAAIDQEIDAAPSEAERAEADRQAQADRFRASLAGATQPNQETE